MADQKVTDVIHSLVSTDDEFAISHLSDPFYDNASHVLAMRFASHFAQLLKPEFLIGAHRADATVKIKKVQRQLEGALALRDPDVTNLIQVSFLEHLYDSNPLAFYAISEIVEEFPCLHYELLSELSRRLAIRTASIIREQYTSGLIDITHELFWIQPALLDAFQLAHMPLKAGRINDAWGHPFNLTIRVLQESGKRLLCILSMATSRGIGEDIEATLPL